MSLKGSSVTVRGHALRDRILEASIAMIETDGLEALSLREVARRAGVSHQAPYRHFADREAILAAICEQGFTILGERVAKAREAGANPTDSIELATRAYIDFAVEHRAHFRIMFRPELVHLDQHEQAMKAANLAFGHVPAMVAEAMRGGLLVEPSAESMTATIWSFAHGYACLLLDGPLTMMMPGAAANPKKATRDATKALRCMLDATIKQGDGQAATESTRRRRSAR